MRTYEDLDQELEHLNERDCTELWVIERRAELWTLLAEVRRQHRALLFQELKEHAKRTGVSELISLVDYVEENPGVCDHVRGKLEPSVETAREWLNDEADFHPDLERVLDVKRYAEEVGGFLDLLAAYTASMEVARGNHPRESRLQFMRLSGLAVMVVPETN